MRWLLVALAVAGCAKAGPGNSIVGGITDAGTEVGDGGVRPDAGDFPEPDASLPPGQLVLVQTTSTAVAVDNSFYCREPKTGFARENNYYRVFVPADHGVTSDLHVIDVTFGIEFAAAGPAGGKQQPGTVVVGTYSGPIGGTTLDLTQMRTISSVDIQIPDGEGVRQTVPITGDISAATNLIVQLTIPDGFDDGNVFIIGSNGDGERRPGYTKAMSCNFNVPTSMFSISSPRPDLKEADVVLIVTASTAPET
ncbi:MAG TPA: hypothetical protein VLM79_29990 [Kofleriaceae bacterium]|nr:hypothetical protein [Kofleriaceae bacterium]